MNALERFGNYLVTNQCFDKQIITRVTTRLEEYGEGSPGALAKILVDEYGMEHDLVYSSLARHYAFGELNLSVSSLESSQIKRVKNVQAKINPEYLATLFEHGIVPFRMVGKNHDILQLIASDPTAAMIHGITLNTPYKHTEVYWSPKSVVQELIERVTQPVSTLLEITEESPQIIETHPAEMEVDEQAVDDEINKSMLVNLFDSILVDAVRNDASDIHIIPVGKNNVELYLRIDGRLKLWYKQENASPESIAAVIKDRSVGVDRFERDTAQDGYAQRLIDDHLIRFRISILPIVSAEFERRFESIVIRVIDDRKVISDFRKLGFQKQAEEEFFKAINTSKGIVIVTGPTGSGKSTTLMAALNHIINPALNVLTCEDPVEYVIKGARQLKIGHKMSFEQAVRSILRHDPDVVMVGEIRDKITADIAVKLANTGHLTLSTLHTNDAPSAITRLYKMGVEPFLLAYSINIIIAQRLVRKLCDKCKRPIGEDQYLAAESMGFTQEEIHSGIIYRPVGCKNCQDGYKGRINIAEALYFYPEIRTEIIRSSSEIDEEHIRSIAEKRGMLSMRASGMDRIRAGLTSIAEVLYATAEE